MITTIDELKTIVKHISCDCKCKFNRANLIVQMKNGIMKHVNVSVKTIVLAKKNYSRNPSISICGNGKYLKSITDEITYVMDIVPTNVTNTITTNVTSVVSIN